MDRKTREFVINAIRSVNRCLSRLIQRNVGLVSSRKIIERFSRPLVLAPHFDDELIGAGGTLLFLAARKADITVCFITDGSEGFRGNLTKEELIVQRKSENAIVAGELGYTSICLDYVDRTLEHQIESAAVSVREVVKQVQPDVVFCPFFFDHHTDHRASALIVVRALMDSGLRHLPIFCYMVGALIPPRYVNAAIDISAYAATKRKLLDVYSSQIEMGFHRVLDYNSYNSIIYLRRRGVAEIFHKTDAAKYSALIRGFSSALTRRDLDQIPITNRSSTFLRSVAYAKLLGDKVHRRAKKHSC
jgi:LmbE family N-acetylglucosaminyl deacetylase